MNQRELVRRRRRRLQQIRTSSWTAQRQPARNTQNDPHHLSSRDSATPPCRPPGARRSTPSSEHYSCTRKEPTATRASRSRLLRLRVAPSALIIAMHALLPTMIETRQSSRAKITTVFRYFSSREITHYYVLPEAVFRCFGFGCTDTVVIKYGAYVYIYT